VPICAESLVAQAAHAEPLATLTVFIAHADVAGLWQTCDVGVVIVQAALAKDTDGVSVPAVHISDAIGTQALKPEGLR